MHRAPSIRGLERTNRGRDRRRDRGDRVGGRDFRSWIADGLEGPWLPWQASGSYAFAGERNVTFEGTAWSHDISHGEMVRTGHDQNLEAEPCGMRFVFQGADPTAETGGDYNKIPWRIGLLTQTP